MLRARMARPFALGLAAAAALATLARAQVPNRPPTWLMNASTMCVRAKQACADANVAAGALHTQPPFTNSAVAHVACARDLRASAHARALPFPLLQNHAVQQQRFHRFIQHQGLVSVVVREQPVFIGCGNSRRLSGGMGHLDAAQPARLHVH